MRLSCTICNLDYDESEQILFHVKKASDFFQTAIGRCLFLNIPSSSRMSFSYSYSSLYPSLKSSAHMTCSISRLDQSSFVSFSEIFCRHVQFHQGSTKVQNSHARACVIGKARRTEPTLFADLPIARACSLALCSLDSCADAASVWRDSSVPLRRLSGHA